MTAVPLPFLTLVEEDERFNTYESHDGRTVYLANDDGRTLVDFHDLDLADEWNRFAGDGAAFRDYIESIVTDPDYVDFSICGDCSDPDVYDDHTWIESVSQQVCESCRESYHYCEDCEEWQKTTNQVGYDTSVCDRCLEDNYSYCDYCAEYYGDYDDGHDHSDSCECESPQMHFRIRNDGHGLLANDERTTVQLPAGTISAEGLGAVARLLRDHARTLPRDTGEEADRYYALNQFSYNLADVIGDTWQTKEGNFTKRLSRHLYKAAGVKLPPAVVSAIGNVGSAHSQGVDHQVEVTRNLNLPAGDFAHEDSCWWQSYAYSRCALKSLGGFGLRTFSDPNQWGETVQGRAWVMPLKQAEDGNLKPTFNTEEPAAFIVFNGYGNLSGYAPARIMAHMAGMTYRKVGFECSPMYVNGDSGYLVAPEDIAADFTDGGLILHEGLYEDSAHSDLYHQEEARGLVTV